MSIENAEIWNNKDNAESGTAKYIRACCTHETKIFVGFCPFAGEQNEEAVKAN